MIRSRFLVWGVLLAAGVFLSGCTTSPLSRIDANRGLYESWPLDVQEAVLEGRVIHGMTPEQVEMSVGKPASKTQNNTRQGTEDVWIYRERSGPNLGGTTIGVGVGPVGVVQSGRGGGYAEEYDVVFVDGQVVRTSLPQ